MKIVLCGSLAVDQIMTFDGLFKDLIQPSKLDVLSISVLIKSLKRTHGGIAGNIAYSLALLGEKPTLFAAIGEDQKNYIESLQKIGVDTSHLHYSALPTATFSVITDQQHCQVGGFYPGAMGDAHTLSVADFSHEDILFVLSAHDPTQMAIQITECQQLKKRLFFDIGQQVIALPKQVLLTGLATAEVLILNDYEMSILANTTELTESEIIHQVKTCVITKGEKGSIVYEQANSWEPITVPAVHVTEVLDPTGAGDAFRAGFLYGYARQWPSAQAAKLGATVAAYAIEKTGTQEHFFTQAELKDRYLENYREVLSL